MTTTLCRHWVCLGLGKELLRIKYHLDTYINNHCYEVSRVTLLVELDRDPSIPPLLSQI